MTGPGDVPVLVGERLSLRPLRPDDVARLAAIGAHPEVADWWPGIDVHYLAGKLAGDDESIPLAVESGGIVIGLIEFYEQNEPDFRHAGIDLFLDPAVRGRGLGGEAIGLLVAHLFDARGHHRITIDPAAANTAAVRCYSKVGFRTVGTLRQYWRDPAGVWQDGLLMELLREDSGDASNELTQT